MSLFASVVRTFVLVTAFASTQSWAVTATTNIADVPASIVQSIKDGKVSLGRFHWGTRCVAWVTCENGDLLVCYASGFERCEASFEGQSVKCEAENLFATANASQTCGS